MFYNQEFKEASEVNINDNVMDNNNYNMCGCPIERCVQKEYHHCVEHIVPIHTRVINQHIYHHVYKPVYTCSEENVCVDTCNPM